MNEKNCLGLDWGERKIGVALAHGETGIALSYGIMENDQRALAALKKICEKEDIGAIVIGVPRFGKKDASKHPAQQFGEALARMCMIEVFYTDEMFTSKLAQASLKVLGEKKVSHGDDAEAAKILLQEWLDQKKL